MKEVDRLKRILTTECRCHINPPCDWCTSLEEDEYTSSREETLRIIERKLEELEVMRVGDVVFHKPSSERWTVAKVYDNGNIIAAGWPLTYGDAKDIEIVKRCNDEQHTIMKKQLSGLDKEDPRYVP